MYSLSSAVFERKMIPGQENQRAFLAGDCLQPTGTDLLPHFPNLGPLSPALTRQKKMNTTDICSYGSNPKEVIKSLRIL